MLQGVRRHLKRSVLTLFIIPMTSNVLRVVKNLVILTVFYLMIMRLVSGESRTAIPKNERITDFWPVT